MPTAAIESAYTPPHERKDGPWDDYELEDAGNAMERAEQIRGNPKMMEAMAKHHAKKAKHHKKMAEGMKSHMKRGLVSEKALAKASESRDA
jgi:hypothetical protein